jgi:hypothetical protein
MLHGPNALGPLVQVRVDEIGVLGHRLARVDAPNIHYFTEALRI